MELSALHSQSASRPQGWFTDPFRRHKARWFSDGSPTALVRDEGVEGNDPPPDMPYITPLEPVVEAEGELLHSHVSDGRNARESGANAIWEIFVATGGD
jgi:hypothetical protein